MYIFKTIVSVLAAAAVFGQTKNNKSEDKCCPTPLSPTIAAYSAPASVNLCDSWNFYADASFIYWQPNQDNMEFGIASSVAPGPANIRGTFVTPVSNSMVNLDPNYKPGFEFGVGMNFDGDRWDSYLQYTWFHCTNSNSYTSPTGQSVFPTFLLPGSTGYNVTFDSASINWHLKMDLADWQLARSYYVGQKLTFRPYFGLRAAWIRQKYDALYVRTSTAASSSEIMQKSTSWGLGLEAGLGASYLLGCDFRLFGDIEADLLYTRYNTSLKEQIPTAPQLITLSQNGLGAIRPHTDIDIGLGWGSYFGNNKWHFDLAASYAFQVFWNQNMFRHFVDDVMSSNSISPNGDLYIQGLNITARLDF